MGFKGGGQSCSSNSSECVTRRMTPAEIASIRNRSELDRGKSQEQLLQEAMARARATNSRMDSIRNRSESDRGKSQGQLLEEAMARARATNALMSANEQLRTSFVPKASTRNSGRKGGFRKTKRRSTKRRSTRRRR